MKEELVTTGDKGIFITFEGGEGSGKSAQVARLAESFAKNNIQVVKTREPAKEPARDSDNNDITTIITDLVLDPIKNNLTAATEALLFAALRLEHLRNLIIPSLVKGKWVICDRYNDSTFAYQGAAGCPDKYLLNLEKVLLDGIIAETGLNHFYPDLTIIMDIDPAIGLQRARVRQQEKNPGLSHLTDHFERKPLSFHQVVRDRFLQVAARNSDRCVVINGDQPFAAVTAEINQIINDRFAIDLP